MAVSVEKSAELEQVAISWAVIGFYQNWLNTTGEDAAG